MQQAHTTHPPATTRLGRATDQANTNELVSWPGVGTESTEVSLSWLDGPSSRPTMEQLQSKFLFPAEAAPAGNSSPLLQGRRFLYQEHRLAALT